MKKILLILNESHIPRQVMQTAVAIAKEKNSFLEAVFISDINALNFNYPFPNDLNLTADKLSSEISTEESLRLIQSIGQVFRDTCDDCKIEYTIDIEKTLSIKELIMLSRFSDLIIADARADTDDYILKELMANSHCPVMLVSKNTRPPEKIFLAYDGSSSSMYAIKMFSYLFTEHKDLPAQFFHISSGDTVEIPHVDEIKTWASKHFSDIKFELIPGNTRKELVDFIIHDSEKAIVVMGAYGGSSIVRAFHTSMAESLINETKASLFITHE
jgi:nucleotide-binding universal stress UspA family protein